jgi:integrase
LPKECFELLQNYKILQEERKQILGSLWKDNQHVFRMVTGECMKPDWLSHNWNKFIDKNNLRHIRLHDLRHTCATYLLSIGTPLATVSRKLGHSDIYTTLNTYTHSLEQDDLEAVEKLANRLFK